MQMKLTIDRMLVRVAYHNEDSVTVFDETVQVSQCSSLASLMVAAESLLEDGANGGVYSRMA